MALNIRNHETEKLAADLAALTGETPKTCSMMNTDYLANDY
jgi:hypothetical protein